MIYKLREPFEKIKEGIQGCQGGSDKPIFIAFYIGWGTKGGIRGPRRNSGGPMWFLSASYSPLAYINLFFLNNNKNISLFEVPNFFKNLI